MQCRKHWDGAELVSSRPPRILIVDDEPLIRLDLADLLESMGFDVLEAANADEAILLLEADPQIGVVVTDIDMPGTMDGLKLAFVVRERWPPCRLIIVSGLNKLSEKDMPRGCLFMSKPLDRSDVRDALSALGIGL